VSERERDDPLKICPITSLRLKLTNDDVRNDYEEIKAPNGSGSIWISRKVMQHGIDHVTVAPMRPCFSKNLYNAAPNQQFWFAEFRRIFRECQSEKS